MFAIHHLALMITLVVLLLLGGVMGARGAGIQFNELLTTWLAGFIGITIAIAAGLLVSFWFPWLGLLLMIVVGLYIVNWMIND